MNNEHNHPTAVSLCLDGEDVSIKSKTDDCYHGWAVIAFTDCVSLRSIKLHKAVNREKYARAILAAMGLDDRQQEDHIETVLAALDTITGVSHYGHE